MARLLLFGCFFLLTLPLRAQTPTDSVIVSGQVKRLSARLYRQSPNVLVTRTNILRGGVEQAFPSPLQPDGRFRVAVPIIYPQEEMQFVIGSTTVAFLATAGNLTIDLDNDSLSVAAVPFRFGGVNAQVNQQYAQYKAFDAKNKPNEGSLQRTLKRVLSGNTSQVYTQLYEAFSATYNQFATQRTVYTLVQDWALANARYDAAVYLFDKALQEELFLANGYVKTVLKGPDNLLTASRAIALNRFGSFCSMQARQETKLGVRISMLARLLERYGKDLTENDRQRLAGFQRNNSAKTSEVNYLNRLITRNPDTLQSLLTYETFLQTVRPQYDSLLVDYLKGYMLASVFQAASLNSIRLFNSYIYPQIGSPSLKKSFSDLVGQALRDSALVQKGRADYLALAKQPGINSGDLGEGIFITTGVNRRGDDVLKQVLDQNRGRVIYAVLWQPGNDLSLQLARDAQRLRDVFSPRELTLLYISTNDDDDELWVESIVRNRLKGEHLRLNQTQTAVNFNTLLLNDPSPVRLFTALGKPVRKSAQTPDKFDQLVAQIQALLR